MERNRQPRIGGEKVKYLHQLCPNIDVVGINSYAGAATLGKRYREAGGRKPYVLTEFGTAGIREIQKDELGAFPENTSSSKGQDYRQSYAGSVLGEPGLCLGSYVFLWGFKQEVTATWFSMLLRDGTNLAPADTMKELWSGRPPANRCPIISSLGMNGSRIARPGETLTATLEATDPEGDPLTVDWILQHDPAQYGTGGDAEEAPPTFPQTVVKGTLHGAEIKMPDGGGLFRLFACVRDSKGGAAVTNVSLRIDAPVRKPQAKPATLPLVVFSELDSPASYHPTGWMGRRRLAKPGQRLGRLTWRLRPERSRKTQLLGTRRKRRRDGVIFLRSHLRPKTISRHSKSFPRECNTHSRMAAF